MPKNAAPTRDRFLRGLARLESFGDFEIQEGAVFLVSGGTAGISLPIVEDLAARTKGRFYLLGRIRIGNIGDVDLTGDEPVVAMRRKTVWPA